MKKRRPLQESAVLAISVQILLLAFPQQMEKSLPARENRENYRRDTINRARALQSFLVQKSYRYCPLSGGLAGSLTRLKDVVIYSDIETGAVLDNTTSFDGEKYLGSIRFGPA